MLRCYEKVVTHYCHELINSFDLYIFLAKHSHSSAEIYVSRILQKKIFYPSKLNEDTFHVAYGWLWHIYINWQKLSCETKKHSIRKILIMILISFQCMQFLSCFLTNIIYMSVKCKFGGNFKNLKLCKYIVCNFYIFNS